MLLKNSTIKKIFSTLSGKYSVKRVISNHGYGEGVAYFLLNNLNELLYKEELKIQYSDYNYQMPTTKEYKYIFADGNIEKHFVVPENNLFYQLDFIDDIKAVGSHLCGEDQYNATYVFLNPNFFTLNYQILGPQKNYNIQSIFKRCCMAPISI